MRVWDKCDVCVCVCVCRVWIDLVWWSLSSEEQDRQSFFGGVFAEKDALLLTPFCVMMVRMVMRRMRRVSMTWTYDRANESFYPSSMTKVPLCTLPTHVLLLKRADFYLMTDVS